MNSSHLAISQAGNSRCPYRCTKCSWGYLSTVHIYCINLKLIYGHRDERSLRYTRNKPCTTGYAHQFKQPTPLHWSVTDRILFWMQEETSVVGLKQSESLNMLGVLVYQCCSQRDKGQCRQQFGVSCVKVNGPRLINIPLNLLLAQFVRIFKGFLLKCISYWRRIFWLFL